LQWWLFYNDSKQEEWRNSIRLWMDGEKLIGWTLLSPDEKTFDVFVTPSLRGDPREYEMLVKAMEEMPTLDVIKNVWLNDKDDVRIRWFEENGFVLDEFHFVYFTRSLSGPVPESPLPSGYSFRTSRGTEEDARLRSIASHGAFGSSKPFEEYWPRTWKFMQSPVYVPEHELFVMSPDGEVAAYCIMWTDPVTKVGHFEPVGTHPKFQRKGLGKSLLFEAMRRFQFEGMIEADVCTNYDNEAAIPLYESVGFKKSKKLLTYKKAGKQ